MQNSTILGTIHNSTANAPWPRTSDSKAQVQGVGGKAPAVTGRHIQCSAAAPRLPVGSFVGCSTAASAVTAFQQPRGAAPLLENHPRFISYAGTWLGGGQGSIGIHVLVHVELVEGVRQNITQGVYFSNTCRAPTSARCSKASHQVSSTLQKPRNQRRRASNSITNQGTSAPRLRMLLVTSPLRRFKRCDVGRFHKSFPYRPDRVTTKTRGLRPLLLRASNPITSRVQSFSTHFYHGRKYH